ncbi:MULTISPECIES: hypothetical protein [Psychrobacter]|uniref:hypothetical protein n=1 Tax=Psychrobacter TaxID=497 RepID=UPI003FD62B7D
MTEFNDLSNRNNLKNWQDLPKGNLKDSQVIIQSEWHVVDKSEQYKALQNIEKTFQEYSLNHHSTEGQKSYYCFLNNDNEHIVHFSQWRDEDAITHFQDNDPAQRIPEMLAGLQVTCLGKQIYYPYKTYSQKKDYIDTRLVVFVKQFFNHKGEATKWIDLILDTFKLEGHINGLIENTFYVNADATELLNMAYWENEDKYQKFLNHDNAGTQSSWQQIKNYPSRMASKGIIKKHSEFLKLL